MAVLAIESKKGRTVQVSRNNADKTGHEERKRA
jgi:hypothetical protein